MAAVAGICEGWAFTLPHGKVWPDTLKIIDGEGAWAPPKGGAGGIPPLQQVQVGVGPQEAGVAVLLHQPVHRALCCIKRGGERLPNALACDFFGVKVQIHLEKEEKCVCLMYIRAYPLLLPIALTLYIGERVFW